MYYVAEYIISKVKNINNSKKTAYLEKNSPKHCISIDNMWYNTYNKSKDKLWRMR